MNAKTKNDALGAAETKTAVVAAVEDTAKPEEVAVETPPTAAEMEKNLKEQKGKNKDKKAKMSCKGIWMVEMKGPYGWEHIAMAFMKNGEYLGAGPNHYSVGSYKEDGDNLEISITLTQCGALRTIFGRKSPDDLQITSKCRFEKNKYIGTSRVKNIKKFDVMIRLTKVGSLE